MFTTPMLVPNPRNPRELIVKSPRKDKAASRKD